MGFGGKAAFQHIEGKDIPMSAFIINLPFKISRLGTEIYRALRSVPPIGVGK